MKSVKKGCKFNFISINFLTILRQQNIRFRLDLDLDSTVKYCTENSQKTIFPLKLVFS